MLVWSMTGYNRVCPSTTLAPTDLTLTGLVVMTTTRYDRVTLSSHSAVAAPLMHVANCHFLPTCILFVLQQLPFFKAAQTMRTAHAVPGYITLVYCQESQVETVVVRMVICTAERLLFGRMIWPGQVERTDG